MAELKRCPFCGGKAVVVCFVVYDDDNDEDVETYSIECKCCGCCTPNQNRESAVETWNSRADARKGFTVIDNKTGNYPDVERIALEEEWAKHLCYCDIDSFAITEDGTLILTDDCGRNAYCPDGRFTVIWED